MHSSSRPLHDSHASAQLGRGSTGLAINSSAPLSGRNGASLQPAFRSPRRVTITLPYATFVDLQKRADREGRSLSNLAAFLLESSLQPENAGRSEAEAARQARRA